MRQATWLQFQGTAVPAGGSFYVLAQILHDWDDGHCATILRNCREAMLPGAKLLIIEQVIPPRNEPSPGKWLDLHMLVLLGGRERTEAEYASLLRAGDLQLDRVIPTTAGASILEVTAADTTPRGASH